MNEKTEIQLALKITTAASIILILILSIIIASSFYASREWLYREFSGKVRALTEWPKILNEVTKWDIGSMPWFIKKRSWPRDIVIIDDDGNVIKNELFDFTHDDIRSLLRSENGTINTKEIWEISYLTYRQKLWGYSLFMFEDMERIYDFHFRLIIIALFGSIFSFVIIFFLAKYLARLSIRPIQEHNKELESYSHNVAHELRTPLSVMRSNLELIGLKLGKFSTHIMWWISQKQEIRGRKIFSKGAYESVSDWENNFYNDEVRSFSDIQRFIQSTDDEISNMEHIIESLLFLAKPTKNKDENKKIDIIRLTEDSIEKYKLKEDIQWKTVNTNIRENIDPELYRRMLTNLIENAIKYKSEWSVFIEIKDNTLSIKNTIEKDIPEEELIKLTKSFYQRDTSRNTEWYWLWLALVEKITKMFGWKMSISCAKNAFLVEIKMK